MSELNLTRSNTLKKEEQLLKDLQLAKKAEAELKQKVDKLEI